jgi:hypothetical protein
VRQDRKKDKEEKVEKRNWKEKMNMRDKRLE